MSFGKPLRLLTAPPAQRRAPSQTVPPICPLDVSLSHDLSGAICFSVKSTTQAVTGVGLPSLPRKRRTLPKSLNSGWG
jgi:hypothetical protein